ncbi:MAG: OmpP1/FadL family transporter [Myxococcota bacterium]
MARLDARSIPARALLAALLLFGADSARAGNDDEVLLGNDAALTGGAVTATVSDGSALWYNPAGLAGVRRNSVDLSASAFTLRSYDAPRFISVAGGPSTGASVREFVSIPSALTMVRRLGEDLELGLGLFTSESSDYVLRETLVTRAPSTSWVLNVATSSAAYHGAAGLAWRLSPDLRVGFGLLGSYRAASSSGWFFAGASGTDGASVVSGAGTQSSAQTLGLQLRAGVQWSFAERWRLGASIRSPEMVFFSTADVSEVQVEAQGGGGQQTSISLTPVEDEDSSGGFDMFLPARVRLGVGWEGDRGRFDAEVDVQHGVTADLPFGEVEREAVWNARVGGRVDVSPTVSLGFGAFTDRSAEPDPEDFAELHVDFYGVTTGVHWETAHRLADDEETPDFVLSTTVGLRYAYGTGDIGSLLVDFATDEVASFPAESLTVHEVSLHLGSGIWF